MRHENLGRALAIGRGCWRTETEAYAEAVAPMWPSDRPTGEWLAMLVAYEEACERAEERPSRHPSGVHRRLGLVGSG